MKERHTNWIARRAECSAPLCFNAIHQSVAEDVRTANGLPERTRLGRRFSVRKPQTGPTGIEIAGEPERVTGANIAFFAIRRRVVVASVWTNAGQLDEFTIRPEWSERRGRCRFMVLDGDWSESRRAPDTDESPDVEAVEYTASRISMRLLEPLIFAGLSLE